MRGLLSHSRSNAPAPLLGGVTFDNDAMQSPYRAGYELGAVVGAIGGRPLLDNEQTDAAKRAYNRIQQRFTEGMDEYVRGWLDGYNDRNFSDTE